MRPAPSSQPYPRSSTCTHLLLCWSWAQPFAPAWQMQEAMESTRTREATRQSLQEQQRAVLQQRTAEVHTEADNLEALSQELRGQLEKLKASECQTHFIWEDAMSTQRAQTPGSHLEAFH